MPNSRHWYFAYSLSISLVVLYVGAGVLHTVSFANYPTSTLPLIPWVFGCYGVVGLLACWIEVKPISLRRLRAQLQLLTLGLVGALIFTLIALVIGVVLSLVLPTPFNAAFIAVFLFAALSFPVLPSVVALRERTRLQQLAREQTTSGLTTSNRFFWGLLLFSLMVVAVRIGAQEIVMYYFGHDLAERATASAENFAQGRPYCVVSFDGTTSLAELDARRMLVETLRDQHPIKDSGAATYPHFGIKVDDELYWWSFKLGTFFLADSRYPWEQFTREQCTAPIPLQ